MIPEHGEHGGPLVNVVARYEDGSDIDVTNEIEPLGADNPDMMKKGTPLE